MAIQMNRHVTALDMGDSTPGTIRSAADMDTLEPFPPAAGWVGIAASGFTLIRLVSGAFERRIRRDLVEGTPTGWLIGSMWVITVAVGVAATAILIGNELLFWVAMIPCVVGTLAYGVEYRINRKRPQ